MLDIDFALCDLPSPTSSVCRWILVSGPTLGSWHPSHCWGENGMETCTKRQTLTETVLLKLQQVRMTMLTFCHWGDMMMWQCAASVIYIHIHEMVASVWALFCEADYIQNLSLKLMFKILWNTEDQFYCLEWFILKRMPFCGLMSSPVTCLKKATFKSTLKTRNYWHTNRQHIRIIE